MKEEIMNYRLLTLEEALTEGKEIAFPMEENKYSEAIVNDRVKYRQIIKQMYNKGMVIGIKEENSVLLKKRL